MARITLEQIKASCPKIDRARIDATDEAEIARHMREDGEDVSVWRAIDPSKANKAKG